MAELLFGQQAHEVSAARATLEHPAVVVRGANAAAEDVGAVLAPARAGVPRVTLPACGLLPHDERPERSVREGMEPC